MISCCTEVSVAVTAVLKFHCYPLFPEAIRSWTDLHQILHSCIEVTNFRQAVKGQGVNSVRVKLCPFHFRSPVSVNHATHEYTVVKIWFQKIGLASPILYRCTDDGDSEIWHGRVNLRSTPSRQILPVSVQRIARGR